MAAITTIIPTYHRPELLKRAVTSVLTQTFRDVSILVSDNANDMATADVIHDIARQDGRVRYVGRPQNLGVYGNILATLEEVDTPFFSILSDDDALLPQFYESAIDGFRDHPDADVFVGLTVQVTDNGLPFRMAPQGWDFPLLEPPAAAAYMIERSAPIWTGLVFRRNCWSERPFLRPEVGAFADFDCLLRLALRRTILFNPIPCALLFVHEGAYSLNFALRDIWPGVKIIADMISEIECMPTADRMRLTASWHRQGTDHLTNVLKSSLIRQDIQEADKAFRVLCEWRPSRLRLEAIRVAMSAARWSAPALRLLASRLRHRQLAEFDRAVTRFHTPIPGLSAYQTRSVAT